MKTVRALLPCAVLLGSSCMHTSNIEQDRTSEFFGVCANHIPDFKKATRLASSMEPEAACKYMKRFAKRERSEGNSHEIGAASRLSDRWCACARTIDSLDSTEAHSYSVAEINEISEPETLKSIALSLRYVGPVGRRAAQRLVATVAQDSDVESLRGILAPSDQERWASDAVAACWRFTKYRSGDGVESEFTKMDVNAIVNHRIAVLIQREREETAKKAKVEADLAVTTQRNQRVLGLLAEAVEQAQSGKVETAQARLNEARSQGAAESSELRDGFRRASDAVIAANGKLANQRNARRRQATRRDWPSWPPPAFFSQIETFPDAYSPEGVTCENTRLPIAGIPSRTPFLGCKAPDGSMFALTGQVDDRGRWSFFWYAVSFVTGRKNCLGDLDLFLTGKQPGGKTLDFDLVRTDGSGKRWYRGHRSSGIENTNSHAIALRYPIASASLEDDRCKIEVCLEGLDLFANPFGKNPQCQVPDASSEQKSVPKPSAPHSESLESLCEAAAEEHQDILEIDRMKTEECGASPMSPGVPQCYQSYENQKLNIMHRYSTRMGRLREKAEKEMKRPLRKTDCCAASPNRYRMWGSMRPGSIVQWARFRAAFRSQMNRRPHETQLDGMAFARATNYEQQGNL